MVRHGERARHMPQMEEEYRDLKTRWSAGERDRELCLHLMFFAWMHWADPSNVTGLTNDLEAEELWRTIFAYLGGETSTDAEFLFIAGIMARVFTFVLGDEKQWSERGSRMIGQAMDLQPTALPLGTFDNRGEYGKYFAHQLRGHLFRATPTPGAPER
jgi:hypothetical protein